MPKEPARPLVAGIDLGGTNILAAVVDAKNNIIGRAKKKTKSDQSSNEIVGRIVKCLRDCLDAAGVKAGEVAALCVGAPGPLDPPAGVVISAPNLGWSNVPLKALLEKELGIPTLLDNDVNIGTYGEFMLGAGCGAKDMIGIFVGTGIGGGLVLQGRLHRGFNHTAGEVGHLVVKMGGPLCGCGNRGCLEAIAGRAGMVREIAYQISRGRKSLVDKLTGGDLEQARSRVLAEAYAKQDPVVVEVFQAAIEALGVTLGGLVNFLSPDTVVIGGGIAAAMGKPYVDAIAEVARRNAFPQCMKNVRIVPAALGDDAGVLGAALLARESLG